MTIRRTDKTRKPPRRVPVRTAARTDDSAKSGTLTDSSPLAEAGELTEPAEAEPEAGPEMLAASEEAEQSGAVPVAEASDDALDTPEDDAESASEETADDATADAPEPAGEQDAPVAEAPAAETAEAPAPEVADGGGSDAHADAGTEPAAPEPALQATADQAPVEEPQNSLAEPVSEAPVAAPETEAGTEAMPESASGAPDREEIPLAAMQSLIEINGRMVAFLQGESQAAVAFWQAAMTARTPGDLVQLHAAEVSRAFDAAVACWTDLARRMGRYSVRAPRQARAA